MDKVNEFYDTDQLKHADPVSGSLNALNHLREMGYRLIIVTARTVSYELNNTVTWLDKHFNGNPIWDSLGQRAYRTKEYSPPSFSRHRTVTALHTKKDVLAHR